MTENRKLDMSLDEIIRMDGIKGPRRGGSHLGTANRRRGGGFGGARSFGGDRRYEPKRLNNGGSYRSRGLYSSSYQPGGQNRFPGGRRTNGYGSRRSATLHVSNLAPSVNSEDVDELFSTFGVLVRAFVHYDQYGNSVGTAEIIFEQRADAIEAKNKLNSVPLDGKPLRIALIDDDGAANDPFSSYLRSSQQRTERNGGSRGGALRIDNRHSDRSRSGGNRRPNSNNAPKPSAEDLDKEMDDWRMQIDNADKLDDDIDI